MVLLILLLVIIVQIDVGYFQVVDVVIIWVFVLFDFSVDQCDVFSFQCECMCWLWLDFLFDVSQVQVCVCKQIFDLIVVEFDCWNCEGLFEYFFIDGYIYYFNCLLGNLFCISVEVCVCCVVQVLFDDGFNEIFNDYYCIVLCEVFVSGCIGVDLYWVEVIQMFIVEVDVVLVGEMVCVWIFYLCVIVGQQEDICLVESLFVGVCVVLEFVFQCIVYLEKKVVVGQFIVFVIIYDVIVLVQYYVIDLVKVIVEMIILVLVFYVVECLLYIVFIDDLCVFLCKVVGDEKDFYCIVQKLFVVVDQIFWVGVCEYFIISNISDYMLYVGYGDCGEQMLLLMILLCFNGILMCW